MNQITKKLLLSVLTVVLTVVALGTTTFAWFTLTDVATIQPVDVEVIGDIGMEISLDEVDWYTTISTAVVTEWITRAENYGAALRLNNVTSSNGFSFFRLGGDPAVTTEYLRIPIYFRSNNVETVVLTQVSMLSQGVNWIPDVTFWDTDSDTVPVPGGSAARRYVASQGARLSFRAMTGPTRLNVYELGDDVAGNISGTPAPTRGNAVVHGEVGPFDSDTKGAINYYYVKTTELPEGADSTISLVETFHAVPSTPGYIEMVDLIIGYLGDTNPDGWTGFSRGGKMFVYLWLEGWDHDTFNAVLADTIRISFEFKDIENV